MKIRASPEALRGHRLCKDSGLPDRLRGVRLLDDGHGPKLWAWKDDRDQGVADLGEALTGQGDEERGQGCTS